MAAVKEKEKEKVNYIIFPSTYWWGLRKKFIQSVPTRVTDGLLAGVLGIAANTAKITALPPLKKMGLIDSDGKPTERAIRWRDDEQYPEVCAEIRSELYPQELLDTFSEPDAPRPAVDSWFARTGVGESASKKMASFYLLLTEANPAKQDGASTAAKTPKAARPAPQARKAKDAAAKQTATEKSNGNAQASMRPEQAEYIQSQHPQNGSSITPSLHIDIQIHIPTDATPEQIESIFASMAKHLYKGNGVHE